MILFADNKWETEAELIAKLGDFFQYVPEDPHPTPPKMYAVYAVKNLVSLLEDMIKLTDIFKRTNPDEIYVPSNIEAFYLGEEDRRYRFCCILENGTKSYYVTKEVTSLKSPWAIRTKTAICSRALFIHAMYVYSETGKYWVRSEDQKLILPNEPFIYRTSRMVEDGSRPLHYPENKFRMNLLWVESRNGILPERIRSSICAHLTSDSFVYREVTSDRTQSEWEFWKRINGFSMNESSNLDISESSTNRIFEHKPANIKVYRYLGY